MLVQNLPAQKRKSKSYAYANTISISAIGDIIVHETQLQSAWDPVRQCYDFGMVFSPIRDLLSEADFTVGNLETTLPGDPSLFSGYPRFGAPDALAITLKNAGIDLLSTANNHACDKGRIGLVHTLDILDQLKIHHIGTYRNYQEFRENRFLLIPIKGFRLAFLNYTYAINGLPIPDGTYVNTIIKTQMAKDISRARSQKPDFIIILLHSGSEYLHQPDTYQKKIVAFLFQEGADIVLGSHPHVIQPYTMQRITDKYGLTKPRLVIYSLGNFLSNQRERYRNGGIIFNFTLKKKKISGYQTHHDITNIQYIPVWVYVQQTFQKSRFYILPVFKYLNNDQFIRLSGESYKEMMTFYHDTVTHLQQSEQQGGQMKSKMGH